MTYILLGIILFLVAINIWLWSDRYRMIDVIERYREVVTEWTLYMHEKNNNRDFALWRKEFYE